MTGVRKLIWKKHKQQNPIDFEYNGFNPLGENKNYIDDYMIPQIKELIDLYQPDFLYFDGDDRICGDSNNIQYSGGKDAMFWKMDEVVAYFYNVAEARGQEVYVNNRLGNFRKVIYMAIYIMLNTEVDQNMQVWTINGESWIGVGRTFGFKWQQYWKHRKDVKEIIKILVDNVSLNGNLDINIGPDRYGNINVDPLPYDGITTTEKESYEYKTRMVDDETILREMGEWLEINSEAIKSTHPWYKRQQDKVQDKYGGPDIITTCYTVKDNFLYAIVLEWPEITGVPEEDKVIVLKDVKPVDGSEVQILGSSENTVAYWQNGTDLIIPASEKPKDKNGDVLCYAWTFKINIGEKAAAPYKPEGLRAMYFNDGVRGLSTSSMVHPVVMKTDPKINFTWPGGTPDYKIGSRKFGEQNNFSARWSGKVKPDLSKNETEAQYKFRLRGDDTLRIWLYEGIYPGFDEYHVGWEDNQGNPAKVETNSVTLKKDQWYPIRVEYIHRGDVPETGNKAFLVLEWEKNGSENWQVVPDSLLSTPDDTLGTGLEGLYYENPYEIDDNSKYDLVRLDQQINFNWDTYQPDSRLNDENNDGDYGVRWRGKIKPLYDGDYYFYTYVLDMLSQDINFSIEANFSFIELGEKNGLLQKKYLVEGLDAGVLYEFELTCKKTYGGPSGNIRLEWESLDGRQKLEIVPAYRLFLPDNPSPQKEDVQPNPLYGLNATYVDMSPVFVNSTFWVNNDPYPDPVRIFGVGSEHEIHRIDENINFDWGAGSPDYRIGADYFAAKWDGMITLPTGESGGTREFKFNADDGVIFKIAEEGGTSWTTVIDTWTQPGSSASGTYNMNKGERYQVQIMYYERGGSASVGPESQTRAILSWRLVNNGELNTAVNKSVSASKNSEFHVIQPAAFSYTIESETILAVQDSYGAPGSTGNVSVNLENAEDIAGAQFTLTDVPDNLTATAVNTTSRTSGFTADFNENDTGALTVILYSPDGNLVQPGDGPIVEISYNISSEAMPGENSQLQLSQVLLSDSDGVSIPVVPQNGNFYFNASKGDVNGDGVVDILDLIRAINIILGILPEPTEHELYAADFNSDENVDVLDIVQIVNYILDNPQQNPSLAVKSTGENTIWIENISSETGQSIEIPVMADFSEKVAGLQLRFSYDPQSITLGEPVTAPRSSGLNVNSRITNGELVVLMYSLDGNAIQPGEGSVLYIPAKLNDNATAGSALRLEEVTLVDPHAGKIPVGITTGFNESAGLPTDFVLNQNYPNPFRSQTRFEYGLPRPADISIKVHNSLGQVVRELVSAKMQAGFYLVSWDGTNDKGLSVLPGIYFYQLNADGNFIGRKKMVVLK